MVFAEESLHKKTRKHSWRYKIERERSFHSKKKKREDRTNEFLLQAKKKNERERGEIYTRAVLLFLTAMNSLGSKKENTHFFSFFLSQDLECFPWFFLCGKRNVRGVQGKRGLLLLLLLFGGFRVSFVIYASRDTEKNVICVSRHIDVCFSSPLLADSWLVQHLIIFLPTQVTNLTTLFLSHRLNRPIRLKASDSLLVSSSIVVAADRLEAPKLDSNSARKRFNT